jgi:hypothetical protein
VRSWIVRHSTEYRSKKATRTFEGRELIEDNIGNADIAVLGTSPAMTNLFAVGIIIVNGPTSVHITPNEILTVETEIQEGTDWLSNRAPASASLNFIREYVTVNLTIAPNKAAGEDYWRDPAMEQLGYGTGLRAVSNYIAELQARHGADWACVGFITMYNNDGVAYHPVGYDYCVLRYPRSTDPSSWRDPNDLDMMFTHEFGHICGADDEPSSWPYPCVMSQNMAWDVCPSTSAAWQW